MSEIDPVINELEARLDSLVRTQIGFQNEVTAIREELARLRSIASGGERTASPPEPVQAHTPPTARVEAPKPPPGTDTGVATPPPPRPRPLSDRVPSFGYETRSQGPASDRFTAYTDNARENLEKFIGENLISKIGIIVLVLGVGIGAKYAIDNELISPLTRIIIGYAFGFGLVGLAVKLKERYLNFSAVLISGGMAIMYFVTFFAYSAYGLIPQMAAFVLMAMFTAFTVVSALVYNRQVIAHIGLVGAYAVPFLLSSDSGNYFALFVYMTIVNTGILAISVKKLWKPIYYTAFAFTWLIFIGWFAAKYSSGSHLYLALSFLTIFHAIFLATRIAQKAFRPEDEGSENIVGAILNGLVFYGLCWAIGDSVAGVPRLWVFFGYLAAMTAAVLIVTARYYKQAFVYLGFPFVWSIFGSWYLNRYDPEVHFAVASAAACAFFSIFYFTVLYYRLAKGSFSFIEHTSAVLSNSFIFYGFGYSIMDGDEHLRNFLGLYTVAHSALHLVVAYTVSQLRASAADVVQVLTILVLTFASIAVPVQFDGNFVTMIWTLEAALLFWFGRARGIRPFEGFSYPVMLFAAGSMFLDWFVAYGDRTSYASELNRLPLANGDLVTAIVFVAAFAFICFIDRDDSYEPVLPAELRPPFTVALIALTVFVLYNAVRIEIGNYHHQQVVQLVEGGASRFDRSVVDIRSLNVVWQLDYTMVFLALAGIANLMKFRSKLAGVVIATLAVCSLFLFCTIAMMMFSDLREGYMAAGEFSEARLLSITIRFFSYPCAALLLYVLFQYSKDEGLTGEVPQNVRRNLFELAAYSVTFIVLSCELVNIMGQLHVPDATKLGLSILWGLYALVMIVVGIAKSRKELRIAAIVLLGVTLAKLFLYDIADLGTIPKTILFVSLGITLLAISFLYNKYKDLIFGSATASEDESPAN